MKRFLFIFFCFVFQYTAQAATTFNETPDFMTTEQILAMAHQDYKTPCASEIFANALEEYSDEIDEDQEEAEVRAWAQTIMFGADVLEQVLDCPEITSRKDIETIVFTPIVFEFDNGRTITINYTTQPKVLKQKLALAKKRSLPNGDPNPRLMDENDPAIYINTDPSWYAIMVVQHGSLSEFVGEGKNNTLSMQWINDNIKSIYPKGYNCTSKSALANDNDTINKVVHEIADLEKDTNDYYVAGDVNLEWIMYAEIVAEIVIAIVTYGIGEAGMVALKGARAAKTSFRLSKNAAKLQRFKHVSEYARSVDKISSVSMKIERNSKNIKNAKKYEKALQEIEQGKRLGKDTTKQEKKAQRILQKAKEIDPNITPEKLKNTEGLISETESLTKQLPEMEKQLEETLKHNKQLLTQRKQELSEVRKHTDTNKIKEYEKIQTDLDKLRDSKDYNVALKTSNDPKIQKRVEELETLLKEYENAEDFKDYARLSNEVKDLESVDDYAKTVETLKDLRKYRGKLEAYRMRPQTGNFVTKGLTRIKNVGKTLRAANDGAKLMNKSRRVARAGMSSRSAKVIDYLFDSTLKHGARFARFYRDLAIVYGAVAFLGDLYDRTSTTSKDFTNGIKFKPLCLLSADDLEGQENEVNYGMWLMWEGNSTDPADDDAAYLQSMDFATKFHYVLSEYQEEHGANCNVDIYVVHPIIRLDESDPNNTKGELFYLFMNDEPWTTADQFGDIDIDQWNAEQQRLETEDPAGKYKSIKTE